MFNVKSGGSGLPEKLGEKQYRQRSKSVRKCRTTKFPQSNGTQRTALRPLPRRVRSLLRVRRVCVPRICAMLTGEVARLLRQFFSHRQFASWFCFFPSTLLWPLEMWICFTFHFYCFHYTGWVVDTRKTLITDCGKALRRFCLFQIFKRAKFCPEYCRKSVLPNSSE